MHKEGDEIHVTEEEATGAVKPHIGRYVLGISLVLIVIAMTLVWVIPSIFG